eukprot:2901936-Heterocapsa_arctica.AAC.1
MDIVSDSSKVISLQYENPADGEEELTTDPFRKSFLNAWGQPATAEPRGSNLTSGGYKIRPTFGTSTPLSTGTSARAAEDPGATPTPRSTRENIDKAKTALTFALAGIFKDS